MKSQMSAAFSAILLGATPVCNASNVSPDEGIAEEPKQVASDTSTSIIALTFDSPLLTLTHPKVLVKQLCSSFRTEIDFLHVRIGV
jgi:hypothetical protein